MCPLCVCKRARFWTRASARDHVRLRAHAQHTPRATHIARPYCSAQRTVTQTPPAQHTCTSRNMRHIAVTYTTKTKQQYSAPQQHDTARHGTDTQTRRSPRNMRHATHTHTCIMQFAIARCRHITIYPTTQAMGSSFPRWSLRRALWARTLHLWLR